MSFKDKIKTMKVDLESTTQESIDRGEDTPDYGSIFIKENIPEGIGFWRPAVGEHVIDIIPFEPAYTDPKIPKGRPWTDHIDVWVHQNVGAMFDDFVCQRRAFKEPDPICEYLRVAKLPTDEWKKHAPKRRTAYLIWSHDTPEEEEKGIQIWEVAYFNFKKHLDKISKNPKGGAPIPFSHVIHGKSIAFEIEESGTWTDSGGKEHPSKNFVGHRFVDRDEAIPEDYITDVQFQLDGCVKFRPTWKEQELSFPLGKELNGAPAATQDTQTDDTPIDDEKEEIQAPGIPAEEEVEKSTELVCPGGGTIGVDLEKLEGCKKCDLWDPCADLADKLKKKGPKKRKAEVKEPPPPPEKKKIMRRRRPVK